MQDHIVCLFAENKNRSLKIFSIDQTDKYQVPNEAPRDCSKTCQSIIQIFNAELLTKLNLNWVGYINSFLSCSGKDLGYPFTTGTPSRTDDVLQLIFMLTGSCIWWWLECTILSHVFGFFGLIVWPIRLKTWHKWNFYTWHKNSKSIMYKDLNLWT